MPASFLEPFQPLSTTAHSRMAPPMGAGGAIAANTLPFAMQGQQQGNWCWAATTASVSEHFNPATPWDQCSIATAALGAPCCTTPPPCNVQFTLDGPLRITNNLQGVPFAGSDVRANVQMEIDAGRPVCCHIGWNAGGGHFVAVSGYDWNTDDVIVDDPLYGRQIVPFTTFATAYRGSGVWDYTYYTQP